MKVGIIGHGSIGRRHAANVVALGHKTLVYDPLDRKDVKYEREIYDECESVVIASPSLWHEAAIRACIERERHMLIEKPISVHEGDLGALLDQAQRKGLVVMTGNNLRFHPCVKAAKQAMRRYVSGRPIWANFICAAETTKKTYQADGVTLNTGSHEVDMAMHLLGPAEVVSASIVSTGTEDTIADFILKHANGCRSSFHLDFNTPNQIRESWIACDGGNIAIDMLGRAISINGKVEGFGGSYDDDYVEEMKLFLDKAEKKHWGKTEHEASGADGLATLKVLLDVRKKAGMI